MEANQDTPAVAPKAFDVSLYVKCTSPRTKEAFYDLFTRSGGKDTWSSQAQFIIESCRLMTESIESGLSPADLKDAVSKGQVIEKAEPAVEARSKKTYEKEILYEARYKKLLERISSYFAVQSDLISEVETEGKIVIKHLVDKSRDVTTTPKTELMTKIAIDDIKKALAEEVGKALATVAKNLSTPKEETSSNGKTS